MKPGNTIILATVVVLILITIAMVLGGKTMVFLTLTVAGVAVASADFLSSGPTVYSEPLPPVLGGGGRLKRKTVRRTLFGQLRHNSTAMKRTLKFIRGRNRDFFPVAKPILLHGPPGDAATLNQLREAWLKDFADSKVDPTGRASSRVKYLDPYLAGIRASLSQWPDYKFIDIGASEGTITAAIANELGLDAEHAVALDIVEQPGGDAVTFARTDGQTIPFPDKEFDLLTMLMSAHHFSDVKAMFAEAARIAKPGARLIIREHGKTDKSSVLFYDAAHALYESVYSDETPPEEFAARYARGKFAEYRTIDEWVDIATAAGFQLRVKSEPREDKFDTVFAMFVR